LVNGCQGIVKQIWYNPGSNPKKDLPAVVFVQCDGYSGMYIIISISRLDLLFLGPATPGWNNIDPTWIPIVPVTARWENKSGTSLSRTQLPLALAWAITIHKSQGLTLTQAVLDLGP
jgi:hypothetical protein